MFFVNGMNIGILLAGGLVLAGTTVGQAADFAIGFDWGNLKRCTSGNPNTVDNPRFSLKNVPAGAASIRFKLVDRNVPGYNHGGGTAKFAGGAAIAPGAFKYKSPCPPDGRHTYEWTATALDAAGKKLGEAKARKAYP
jgi:phosphatidylethanolamine-binding protein (PEBP) family uncharacterized protein